MIDSGTERGLAEIEARAPEQEKELLKEALRNGRRDD